MTTLATAIFWGVVGVTGLVSLLLSYSVIRFQRKLAHKSTGMSQFRDHSILGFIWTLVPVGLLAILLFLAFQSMQF